MQAVYRFSCEDSIAVAIQTCLSNSRQCQDHCEWTVFSVNPLFDFLSVCSSSTVPQHLCALCYWDSRLLRAAVSSGRIISLSRWNQLIGECSTCRVLWFVCRLRRWLQWSTSLPLRRYNCWSFHDRIALFNFLLYLPPPPPPCQRIMTKPTMQSYVITIGISATIEMSTTTIPPPGAINNRCIHHIIGVHLYHDRSIGTSTI